MLKVCTICGVSYETTDRHSAYCSLACFCVMKAKKAHDPEHIRARHNRHVDVTPGCWIWTGNKTAKGYGRIGIASRTLLAHRIAYELYVGPIPAGLGVLHKCDNPPCVNPSHLFVGTAKENAEDKARKGRAPRGETHPQAKFSEEQVLAMLGDTRPYNEIVAEYGVSKPHLCGLKRGHFWRHVRDNT